MEENTFERDPHIDSLRKATLLNWAIESGCYIITDNDRKITIITKDLRTQQIIQVNVKSGYMSAAEIANYMNSLDHAFNEMALTEEQKYPGEGIIKRHEDWTSKPKIKKATLNESSDWGPKLIIKEALAKCLFS